MTLDHGPFDTAAGTAPARDRPVRSYLPFRPASREELTELGANLRHALDGQLADERAAGPATFPAEHLHRDPGHDLEQAREWVLNRLRELDASGFGSAGLITKAGEARPGGRGARVRDAVARRPVDADQVRRAVRAVRRARSATSAPPGTTTRFLPDITSLKLLGCFAMTETRPRLRRRRHRDHDHLRARRPTSSR